jgi:putative protease
MRILAPCAAAPEVEALITAGADELYCGIFPQAWYETWGRGAWPNRRGPGPANLATVDGLRGIAEAAHAGRPRRAPVFLALNQQFYTDAQAELLLSIAKEAWATEAADAFIVSDPGFMILLRAEIPGCRVFASTVSVILNAESVRFFESIGCSRTILSRHLRIDEIRAIVREVPGVEIEVFLLNDACYFEEGLCSTTHSMPGFGVYCMTPWELGVRRDAAGEGAASGPIEDPEERARWDFLLEEHREFLRQLAHRGTGAGRTAMPLGPCGLCAIPDLVAAGVHSGKIVGREASLFRKLRSIQTVRHVRDVFEQTADATEAKRVALELRGDPSGCAGGYSCYYREARDRSLIPLPGRARGPRPPRSPSVRSPEPPSVRWREPYPPLSRGRE